MGGVGRGGRAASLGSAGPPLPVHAAPASPPSSKGWRAAGRQARAWYRMVRRARGAVQVLASAPDMPPASASLSAGCALSPAAGSGSDGSSSSPEGGGPLSGAPPAWPMAAGRPGQGASCTGVVTTRPHAGLMDWPGHAWRPRASCIVHGGMAASCMRNPASSQKPARTSASARPGPWTLRNALSVSRRDHPGAGIAKNAKNGLPGRQRRRAGGCPARTSGSLHVGHTHKEARQSKTFGFYKCQSNACQARPE